MLNDTKFRPDVATQGSQWCRFSPSLAVPRRGIEKGDPIVLKYGLFKVTFPPLVSHSKVTLLPESPFSDLPSGGR